VQRPYDELRRFTATMSGHAPAASLRPTGLVNEVWRKFSDAPAVAHTMLVHFKQIVRRRLGNRVLGWDPEDLPKERDGSRFPFPVA
jgi:hypothetical protein